MTDTFSHDPNAKSYKRIRRIHEICAQLDLDWRDPANREALADIAFEGYARRFGPPPSDLTHHPEAQKSWFALADRLREVQLPEFESLAGEHPSTA